MRKNMLRPGHEDPRGAIPIEVQLKKAHRITAFGKYFFPTGNFFGDLVYYRHNKYDASIFNPLLRNGTWEERTQRPEHVRFSVALSGHYLSRVHVEHWGKEWTIDFEDMSLTYKLDTSKRGEFKHPRSRPVTREEDYTRHSSRAHISRDTLDLNKVAYHDRVVDRTFQVSVAAKVSQTINEFVQVSNVPARYIKDLGDLEVALRAVVPKIRV